MKPEAKAALRDLLFKCSGGISDMANEELAELDRILQPEIERLVVLARIDEAQKARDCILYDEQAIDKIDKRIWQLKGESNA